MSRWGARQRFMPLVFHLNAIAVLDAWTIPTAVTRSLWEIHVHNLEIFIPFSCVFCAFYQVYALVTMRVSAWRRPFVLTSTGSTRSLCAWPGFSIRSAPACIHMVRNSIFQLLTHMPERGSRDMTTAGHLAWGSIAILLFCWLYHDAVYV